MSILVVDPGVQCTVQAAPRVGYRQAGVPFSGPADPLSMALANRLTGQSAAAPCLEVSYGPATFTFEAPMQIAVTGAPAGLQLNGAGQPMHTVLNVAAGNVLSIGAVSAGARVYLAVSGELQADAFLGSRSTYLPAGFGGHQGRALGKGDRIAVQEIRTVPDAATPESLRLPVTASYALRAVPGPDLNAGPTAFQSSVYRVSRRVSRMAAEIEGEFPSPRADGLKPSSAVFPGALQVTPQGRGFLLLPDGQTTGGYPHLLQVIRADRHLLGQLRPGDNVHFVMRTQVQAEDALRAKQALIATWIPDFRL